MIEQPFTHHLRKLTLSALRTVMRADAGVGFVESGIHTLLSVLSLRASVHRCEADTSG
ncbi:MAG: hypothetical protein ABJ327_23700 [Litoreibacter sp.]